MELYFEKVGFFGRLELLFRPGECFILRVIIYTAYWKEGRPPPIKRNENIVGTALHSTNLNIPVYPLETRKLHKMFQKRNQKRKWIFNHVKVVAIIILDLEQWIGIVSLQLDDNFSFVSPRANTRLQDKFRVNKSTTEVSYFDTAINKSKSKRQRSGLSTSVPLPPITKGNWLYS